MRPVRVESSNFTYVGPHPTIADLPCRVEGETHGDGVACSVYRLTDEERVMIANGAQVELAIFQLPIPPVALRVVNEPEAPGEDDLRCDGCDAIYLRSRELDTCGQCGAELLPDVHPQDVHRA